jgi:hypothetical protein
VRLRLDKIASSTRNVALHRDVTVGGPIPALPGIVLAVRVLDTKTTYNHVEDVHGRMMRIQAGDIVAGVLGARRALRGFAGDVPPSVAIGDTLHLLNLGGVIGLATSANPDVGPPCRVEVLGAILRFPELGRRVGVPASIQPGPVSPRDDLPKNLPPLILVAGTCMHAGKTAAACLLVREATARGLRVGATKVTGVALRRDSLEMVDHGAVATTTFCDAGLPSTANVDVVPVARGCIAAVAHDVDLVVVELGDGIFGSYGVDAILADPAIRAARSALVLAATDPVAAWGGVTWLRREGWDPAVVTGPATDNSSGCDDIEARCGLPAVNARSEAARFAQTVMDALGDDAPAAVRAG